MDILELQKRTILVLEKSKKNINEYGRERKILDQYLRKNCYDIEWERYLITVEQKLNINKM